MDVGFTSRLDQGPALQKSECYSSMASIYDKPKLSDLRMLRASLLLLVLALAAIGLLNVIKSPAWSPWRLAVLAGEYGHWLAIAPVIVAGLAWWTRGDSGALAAGTVVVAGLAALLLLKPSIQAWRISSALPARLEAQFGVAPLAREPFAFSGLVTGTDPVPVSVETLEVAPGLPLDFYHPTGASGKGAAPCVIIVHGGGWDGGDRKQIPHFNHWLAGRGYAVAAISYRLAPQFQWPAQRDDVLAAIAFLKTQATRLGIDPTRLVLLGRSAGGQIALTVGFTAGDPAIRGVIGMYAPSDLIFGYVNTHEDDMLKSPALMRQYLGGTPESARANYESASALFHVGRRTPPTLLVHGTNDALVWHRHGERLDARLAEQGVPHVLVQLPWATHAFDFNLHGPGGQLTTYAIEWFLTGVTK
jgi:acetyl esterase/lipase